MMATSSKTRKLAVDTLLFGISTFGSKILVFLLTPLYTAVLLTEEYGVADIISTTVNLIYPVLTLAITDAVLRYALDKECNKNAVLGNALTITMLSVLLLMAFYPVFTMLNSEITVQISGYWGYFVATYAMYNLHLCFANFTKGIGNTKLYAIQGIVQTGTVVLCNVYFLLFAKIGLTGYLLSVIIGLAVPTILMFIAGGLYRYIFPFRLDKGLLMEMLKYSIPMIPTLLAWSINMYINKYMLIGLLPQGEGLSASGIFSIANKIPSILTAVISIFTHAWQLSAISNVNDPDESNYYTKIYRYLHFVSLAGCLVVIPFSQIASKILFAQDYYPAWQHIPFLTMSAFFSSLCGFLASAFRAYKKTGQLFISVAIGAVVNIISSLVLIETVGVVGASIATTASFLVTWAVRMLTIQKLVKVKICVLQTVATYALAVFGCLVICFEVPFAYFLYSIACVIILVINISEVKLICGSVIAMLKRMIKKI